MKRLIYIIAAALTITFASNTQAQVKTEAEVITLTANLNTTMSLNIDKSDITFDFTTLNDYKNGLGGYDSDKYSSIGSVTSTANWNLSYKAEDEFTHQDGGTMSLDNVGLSVEWMGSNRIKAYAETEEAPLALSKSETVILGHDGQNSNAGDAKANYFKIFWEMGTKKGNMNSASIFEQDLKKGSYSTKVEFIATEVL